MSRRLLAGFVLALLVLAAAAMVANTGRLLARIHSHPETTSAR